MADLQKMSSFENQTPANMGGSTDFVGGYTTAGDGKNRKFSLANLADWFLTRNTLQLSGRAQSVKAAIDDLNNSKLMGYPRCKDITSYFTDGTLWNRIKGTGYPYPYYDIQPGDYIDMGRAVTAPNVQEAETVTPGSRYVTVVSLGGLYGNGDSSVVNYEHLVMVPGQGLGGTQHFGKHRMNSTNTTEGGYVGSEMFTSVLGEVAETSSTEEGATINQQLKAIFGEHLKTTREYLANAINGTLVNRYGSATGAASGWEWKSVQACLMSEIEVYGSIVWSSSAYNTGTACKQFELFAMSKRAINNRSAWYWLKDVVSSSNFARVDNVGHAYYGGASSAGYYVRPRFIIA